MSVAGGHAIPDNAAECEKFAPEIVVEIYDNSAERELEHQKLCSVIAIRVAAVI